MSTSNQSEGQQLGLIHLSCCTLTVKVINWWCKLDTVMQKQNFTLTSFQSTSLEETL